MFGYRHTLAFLAIICSLPSVSCTEHPKERTPAVVKDADGNVYQTVTIGTQVWMVENLKSTRFSDGTPIPLLRDSVSWRGGTTSGYCWYKGDSAKYCRYGALYNWFAVNTGKLAPTGWHVPTDEEWIALCRYAYGICTYNETGGPSGVLKDTSGSPWGVYGATNRTGFTALPGGYRTFKGFFTSAGHAGGYAYWWTSNQDSSDKAWYHGVAFDTTTVYRHSGSKQYGFSVRCIKNQ
jgi:uncharacterized protein (TIGR02145 family)